jgi:hypothetical protein
MEAQRQHLAVVLEQDAAPLGDLACDGLVSDGGGVLDGDRRQRVVEQAAADVGADHPEGGRIDVGLGDLPGRQRGVQALGREEDRPVELLVEPVDQRRRGRVDRPEIRHHVAVEPHVALEDRLQERVLAGVDAVDLVVGAHDALGPALADGDLEGQIVDLAAGALVDVGGAEGAVELLLVGDVVLEVGQDRLVGVAVLQATDVAGGQQPAEYLVLAQVLRGPA